MFVNQKCVGLCAIQQDKFKESAPRYHVGKVNQQTRPKKPLGGAQNNSNTVFVCEKCQQADPSPQSCKVHDSSRDPSKRKGVEDSQQPEHVPLRHVALLHLWQPRCYRTAATPFLPPLARTPTYTSRHTRTKLTHTHQGVAAPFLCVTITQQGCRPQTCRT